MSLKVLLLPLLISFLITVIANIFLIPVLRKLKMGQPERELGVESHLAKAGTPTMGGISFLIGIIITSFIFGWKYPQIWPVLFLTVAFAAVGFVDDYLKVVRRQSDGLSVKQKLLLELIVSIVFFFILKFATKTSLELLIPFKGNLADISWFALPLMIVAVLGTVNGVNFTDGLDGLNTSVTIVVALFFAVAAVLRGAAVSPIITAVIGGLMGFLIFNAYPASVFMGDTGSLALGGFVIGTAYMLQMPLFVIIVGFVYLAEVVSVILQVGYFKLSGGKRIFKMAPIHHHFELSGFSETKVVALFTVVTGILAAIGGIAL